MLIFILYMSSMCLEMPAHMHGLISCWHHPHTDGETEAQMMLGLALLCTGQGPVCGLPSHFSTTPSSLRGTDSLSHASPAWLPLSRPGPCSSTHFLHLPAGAQTSGHSPTSCSPLEPHSGRVLFMALPMLWCYVFDCRISLNPLGSFPPAINVNSSLKNHFCHLISYLRPVIPVFSQDSSH